MTWTVANTSSSTVNTNWKTYNTDLDPRALTRSDLEAAWYDGIASRSPQLKIDAGKSYPLPDGATLIVDDKGNYRIDDKDAQVVYKANRIREFSPHLNASDMLAQFVEYVAGLGLKRDEALGLPIKLFISWLIIEAAERDGDPIPDDVPKIAPVVAKPRCEWCQRYIPRRHFRYGFPFCDPNHAQRRLAL